EPAHRPGEQLVANCAAAGQVSTPLLKNRAAGYRPPADRSARSPMECGHPGPRTHSDFRSSIPFSPGGNPFASLSGDHSASDRCGFAGRMGKPSRVTALPSAPRPPSCRLPTARRETLVLRSFFLLLITLAPATGAFAQPEKPFLFQKPALSARQIAF